VDVINAVQQYRQLDHEVMIHKDRHRGAVEWCQEQFGKRWEAIGYRAGTWAVFWAGRNHPGKYRFCFAHERDLVWFTLRWL
jgi:hypothetical protein